MWGCGPRGASPFGWYSRYRQQVTLYTICSLGILETQPRTARAALLPRWSCITSPLELHYFPVTLFTQTRMAGCGACAGLAGRGCVPSVLSYSDIYCTATMATTC